MQNFHTVLLTFVVCSSQLVADESRYEKLQKLFDKGSAPTPELFINDILFEGKIAYKSAPNSVNSYWPLFWVEEDPVFGKTVHGDLWYFGLGQLSDAIATSKHIAGVRKDFNELKFSATQAEYSQTQLEECRTDDGNRAAICPGKTTIRYVATELSRPALVFKYEKPETRHPGFWCLPETGFAYAFIDKPADTSRKTKVQFSACKVYLWCGGTVNYSRNSTPDWYDTKEQSLSAAMQKCRAHIEGHCTECGYYPPGDEECKARVVWNE